MGNRAFKRAGWQTVLLSLVLTGACGRMDASETNVSNETASNAAGPDMDINLIIPANEIDATMQRARAGDMAAANQLANHFRDLHQRPDETRWLLVGASRGDCYSLSWLKENAQEAHNRAEAAHWNGMLRRYDCTWARTFRRGATENSASDLVPLWNDQ